MTESIEDELRTFLSHELGGGQFEIKGLERAGLGRSRQNWFFDLVLPDGACESLVLRGDPPGGLVSTDRGAEFALLQALERSGLPTPAARWLDATGAALGRPSLIMRRIDGDCEYLVLNGSRPLAERRALAETFCELLADVHRVDWRGLGLGELLTDPGQHAAATELEHWRRILREDQVEAYPELELAITWLDEFAPLSQGTVLVHADFKPGNLLLEGDRVTALLDWELAHLGDPLEDLAWVTQPLRSREHTIASAWEASDLIEHYSATSGRSVDPAALAWWSIFSTFKTAVMQVSGLRSFLEGRSDESYRPTRRVLRGLLDALAEAA